jgi:hypothetical protein
MAFGRLFTKEVYIRLTDSGSTFMCTVQYGTFYSRVTEFLVDSKAATSLHRTAATALVKSLIKNARLRGIPILSEIAHLRHL